MNTNGHGHVRPNADGSKTRCGGPPHCGVCNAELATLNTPPPPATPGELTETQRDKVPAEVHERGWQWRPVGDGAFAPPFGTVRACLECGCLVAGGPTRCGRCTAPRTPPPATPGGDVASVLSLLRGDGREWAAEIVARLSRALAASEEARKEMARTVASYRATADEGIRLNPRS